ncbi:P-type ATPase [Lasiodiplodia theobromae]|uniref:P-type ATPase n=1 Tax=Lasiodiplodia theobromae TaxID=45133 RepID=UPI0015C2E020|nr:P-type ATPase [Lasiodiplodia theobromae]KAF4537469.1 P-type ATPase [Lasiodiplodia theobromae]
MKFLVHLLSISSFALLGLAAPVAEPKALNGVAGASGTIGNVANAVSTPISLPSDINTVPDTVIGAVYGILSGTCGIDWKCNITLSGTIEDLLVDGDKYTGQASVAAWCDEGRCYGATDIDTSGTAPLVITCDQVTGSEACTGTIYGAADVIFSNGKQLEVWGWMTPSGYCNGGTCYASLHALGDPMY